MKGFVDAAPMEARDELRKIAPYLEMWMLMKDGEAIIARQRCSFGHVSVLKGYL
jgi:hypothetical protein